MVDRFHNVHARFKKIIFHSEIVSLVWIANVLTNWINNIVLFHRFQLTPMVFRRIKEHFFFFQFFVCFIPVSVRLFVCSYFKNPHLFLINNCLIFLIVVLAGHRVLSLKARMNLMSTISSSIVCIVISFSYLLYIN